MGPAVKSKTYKIRISFSGGFFTRGHFNVTPAPRLQTASASCCYHALPANATLTDSGQSWFWYRAVVLFYKLLLLLSTTQESARSTTRSLAT